jgi:hypothetical protein
MSRFYDTQGLPLNLGDLYQGRLPGFGPEGLLAAAAAGFPGSLPPFGPPFPMGLQHGLPGMMMQPRSGDEGIREESPASSLGSSHSEKASKKRRLSHDGHEINTTSTHGSSFEALSVARDKMSMEHERLTRPQNNNSEKADKNAHQEGNDEDTDNEVVDKENTQHQREEDFDEEEDEETNLTRESSPSTSQTNSTNAATAPIISCPISC